MKFRDSEIVSGNAIELIVRNGVKQVQDNQTVRKHLFNYSSRKNAFVTHQLMFQDGVIQKSLTARDRAEPAPSVIKKDLLCNKSIHFSHCKKDSPRDSQTTKFRETVTTRSPAKSRRSSAQAYRKNLIQKRSSIGDTRFIDLSQVMQPQDKRIITRAMKQEQNYVEQLRNKRIEDEKKEKKNAHENQKKELQELQRGESMKSKLNKHLSQKANSVSFDIDGNLILVEAQKQHLSIRKKYPPSNLSFDFQAQDDPNFGRQNNVNIKQKAARGQAFASAVLKTMNMSKFSLNMTSKTCNIDEFAFMKRNDLFNNNHSRQVTTIPFLRVSQGTNYTQTRTNLSVGKKTDRTSHSANKSKFKTHQLDLKQNNTQEKSNKTQMVEDDEALYQKKRVQSSRPYMRPKTSHVPHSAKTTDRITKGKKQLIIELIY